MIVLFLFQFIFLAKVTARQLYLQRQIGGEEDDLVMNSNLEKGFPSDDVTIDVQAQQQKKETEKEQKNKYQFIHK